MKVELHVHVYHMYVQYVMSCSMNVCFMVASEKIRVSVKRLERRLLYRIGDVETLFPTYHKVQHIYSYYLLSSMVSCMFM